MYFLLLLLHLRLRRLRRRRLAQFRFLFLLPFWSSNAIEHNFHHLLPVAPSNSPPSDDRSNLPPNLPLVCHTNRSKNPTLFDLHRIPLNLPDMVGKCLRHRHRRRRRRRRRRRTSCQMDCYRESLLQVGQFVLTMHLILPVNPGICPCNHWHPLAVGVVLDLDDCTCCFHPPWLFFHLRL